MDVHKCWRVIQNQVIVRNHIAPIIHKLRVYPSSRASRASSRPERGILNYQECIISGGIAKILNNPK